MSVWTAVSTTVLATVIVLIHKGVSSAAVALITQWTQMDNAYVSQWARCGTIVLHATIRYTSMSEVILV